MLYNCIVELFADFIAEFLKKFIFLRAVFQFWRQSQSNGAQPLRWDWIIWTAHHKLPQGHEGHLQMEEN